MSDYERDYAVYDDVYGPGGMADDRDDSLDPEFHDPGGYCEHGTYVGGCGPDLMCGPCEDGISAAEMRAQAARDRLNRVRTEAQNASDLLNNLLTHSEGVPGSTIARWVEDSMPTHFRNPLSRYGRH